MAGNFFIEMSRDENHGGGSWSFKSCAFAPTQKKGGGSWAFWSTILDVQPGDIILHLRGKPPNAEFVGYSTASDRGFETSNRPPDPGVWSFSNKFYKVDLEGFVPFEPSINLNDVFRERSGELRHYFLHNKEDTSDKLPLFYVIQRGSLQCLNGAYFSKGDSSLLEALFGDGVRLDDIAKSNGRANVHTSEGLAVLKVRIGQRDFAKAVKLNYSGRCCFPKCPIDDDRFLVASHIARWSDVPEMRGEVRNGLCFCVFHDRAFEAGIFTLDQNSKVFLNPTDDSKVRKILAASAGLTIRAGKHMPLPEALLEHWLRVDIDPLVSSSGSTL